MDAEKTNGHAAPSQEPAPETAPEPRNELITQPSGQQDSIYSRAEASERLLFKPPIDIYESDDGLVLLADLPGVSVDTLELQVQDNKLTLFGRVKMPVSEDAALRHCEYHEGDFLRSFILSDEVDYDRVAATLNNGVLRVVLPKTQKAEPRRIEVQSD
jgi:HSP20 family molecular chaperone IbpA